MTGGQHEGGVALACDALLFDLDGTLVASTPLIERAWQQWFDLLRVSPPSWSDLHGRTARGIAREFVAEGQIEWALDHLTQIEMRHSRDAQPVPGAIELLTSIPVARFAIVTGARRDIAMTRIRAAGIREDGLIIAGDDVSRGKPHAEGFLTAAQQLNVGAARCVAFEDSRVGITAANAAGCITIRVGDASNPLGAHFACDDLTSVTYHQGAVRLR